MNRAKMPQLESPLPERSRRKKNPARRTHVAECRLYAADRSRMPSECRHLPQPDRRRLYRLGQTAPTADRPEKITLIKNFAGPDHSQKIPVFSPPHHPMPPPLNFAQPFSPGYTLSFPRLIPTYRPGPQAIGPQPMPTAYTPICPCPDTDAHSLHTHTHTGERKP